MRIVMPSLCPNLRQIVLPSNLLTFIFNKVMNSMHICISIYFISQSIIQRVCFPPNSKYFGIMGNWVRWITVRANTEESDNNQVT